MRKEEEGEYKEQKNSQRKTASKGEERIFETAKEERNGYTRKKKV
jgi:hypothetical protein